MMKQASGKFLSILLILISFAIAVFSCADHDMPPSHGDEAIETSTNLPDSTQPEADTTDSPSIESPEMIIEPGYTVLAHEKLSIPVENNKSKVSHTARIAALRNTDGENALYFDVLSEDEKILSSITWKGNYQLFINNEGMLTLMRIAVSPFTQRGTALYQCYTVSDNQYLAYDVIKLDSPQINPIPGVGESINFVVGSPATDVHYKYLFLNFVHGYRYKLDSQTDEKQEIYLIADSYLEPENPSVYSPAQKVAIPNFEDKSIADKYTWAYAIGLFSSVS